MGSIRHAFMGWNELFKEIQLEVQLKKSQFIFAPTMFRLFNKLVNLCLDSVFIQKLFLF